VVVAAVPAQRWEGSASVRVQAGVRAVVANTRWGMESPVLSLGLSCVAILFITRGQRESGEENRQAGIRVVSQPGGAAPREPAPNRATPARAHDVCPRISMLSRCFTKRLW